QVRRVGIAIIDAELTLISAPDLAELALRIGGELLGHSPGIHGRLLDHGGLDLIQLGEHVCRALAVLIATQRDALLAELRHLSLCLANQIDLSGIYGDGL